MSRVGQKTMEIRTAKGLSSKVISKKIGVSESFLLDVESGRKIPNENLISRLSKVLGVNLNDTGGYDIVSDEKPDYVNNPKITNKTSHIKKPSTPPDPQWEHAFTSIITDVPIYDSRMLDVVDNKKAVVVNKKVEGIPIDKAFYYQVDALGLESYQLKKNDLVLIHRLSKIVESGTYIIKHNDTIKISQVKVIENKLLLASSHHGNISTETVSPQDITVIGRCMKAEIIFS